MNVSLIKCNNSKDEFSLHFFLYFSIPVQQVFSKFFVQNFLFSKKLSSGVRFWHQKNIYGKSLLEFFLFLSKSNFEKSSFLDLVHFTYTCLIITKERMER